MSKRISKRVREEAAAICSMRAAQWASCVPGEYPPDELFDEDGDPIVLAIAAYMAVPTPSTISFSVQCAEEWAEAESWLRTGWEP